MDERENYEAKQSTSDTLDFDLLSKLDDEASVAAQSIVKQQQSLQENKQQKLSAAKSDLTKDNDAEQKNPQINSPHQAHQSTEVKDTETVSQGSHLASKDSIAESKDTKESNLVDLRMKRAMEIVAGDNDQDLNSIQEPSDKHNEIKNVHTDDNNSITSDVTDLTDNTSNLAYHNECTSDQSVTSDPSLITIKSLKSVHVQAMIAEGMDDKEIEKNIISHAHRSQVLIARNATALLAKHLKNKRLNGNIGPINSDDVVNDNPPPDKSNHDNQVNTSSTQSTNNCNVGLIK